MTQEFPNQTSSPLWTSESVRLEKLAWRQDPCFWMRSTDCCA